MRTEKPALRPLIRRVNHLAPATADTGWCTHYATTPRNRKAGPWPALLLNRSFAATPDAAIMAHAACSGTEKAGLSPLSLRTADWRRRSHRINSIISRRYAIVNKLAAESGGLAPHPSEKDRSGVNGRRPLGQFTLHTNLALHRLPQ
jgi:hypothetical protein